MPSRSRSHLTYANVMATIAVFLAVGGGVAWALGTNTVRSKHIVDGQVKTPDLRANSVNGGKIQNGSLSEVDLSESSLSGLARGFTATDSFTSDESLELTAPGVGTLSIVDCNNGATVGNDSDDVVGPFHFSNQSGATLVYAWSIHRTHDSSNISEWNAQPTSSSLQFANGVEDATWIEFIASQEGGGVGATFHAFAKELPGENCRGVINAVRNR